MQGMALPRRAATWEDTPRWMAPHLSQRRRAGAELDLNPSTEEDR